MLDRVSWLMNQLPVQITQHEMEGDCKEERDIKFGNFMTLCRIRAATMTHFLHLML